MRLRDTVQAEITKELSYPGIDGFKVTLKYLGKEQFKEIQKKCVVKDFDKDARKRVEVVDMEKFKNYVAKEIVLDWKGLTWNGLKQLAPVKIPADVKPTDQIEPTFENKLDVLEMSINFNNWVDEMVKDFINFEEEEKTAEYDNLK